jgi:hypothetical protein
MQVHMLTQVLTPGVQHCCHAQLTRQSLRVMTQCIQGIPDTAEQSRVNHAWMKSYPTIQRMRQGKHQMEVAGIDHIGQFPLLPLLTGLLLTTGAMTITAGMVKHLFFPTFLALQLKTT